MRRRRKRKKKPKGRLFFYFISLLAFFPLAALDPGKSITQYRLDIWEKEPGLEQNSVFAIAQTHDGFIWLGTLEGLLRFDGNRFKIFNKTNTSELKSNIIRALYEDRKGRLWIGTSDGGLSYMKGGIFTTYTIEEYRALKEISSIFEDRKGTLWIGTLYNGLTRLKNGKFNTYTTVEGLSSNKIFSVRGDKKGNLLIATSRGLIKRTPFGRFTGAVETPDRLSKYIFSFCERKNGELWIGSNNGLGCVKNRTSIYYGVAEGLPNQKVMYLYEDKNRTLWGGTDGGGLFRVKNGKIETYSTEQGMTSGFVCSIYEEREGGLWIGTLNGGLHRLRDTTITMYTSREGLGHDIVNCLCEDRDGNLWVGTEEGGISRIKDGECTLELTTKQGLLSNTVHSILEDRAGLLWIATEAGLQCLENGKLTNFTTGNGLPHNRVLYLMEDKQGTIWIKTSVNIIRFRENKFSIFTEGERFFNKIVRFIHEDRQGRFWFGTFGGGIYRLKNGKFTHYTVNDGLVNNETDCIYEDNEGNLYIGTRGGLSLLAEGKFINYTTQSGLIDNRISYIMEDLTGNLWLATRRGISCIGKQELFDVARGKIDKIQPVTYDETDGMKSRWCQGGIRTRDGRLWFISFNGLAMIDPADLKKNTLPPRIIIEDLMVDGEQININYRNRNPLYIPPGVKRLEFYYTGLSFVNPQKIKFKIRLVGYDPGWLDVGHVRSTIYTRLSPGKYTFKVIACNSDGIWNQTGASFSFYMKPYIYQTYWFYIIMALLVGFLAFFGYRFRVKQMKRREMRLSALVEQRTRALNDRTRELEKAHHIIEEKNRNILASIEYARRIQQVILPTPKKIKTVLKDYFILFKPKDIVSGDFYWFGQGKGKYFIAAVDCTGHGVPGAFLSVIGNMKLNEILEEKNVSNPAQLLAFLDSGVRTALKQETGENGSNFGMEAAVCMVDLEKKKIIFAGAGRPLFYIENSELIEIKGDRKAVGGRRRKEHRTFTNHEINFHKEIIIYLTTDGFADQDNAGGKRYGSRRVKRLLRANASLGMARQKETLLKALNAHRGGEEQRDDITVIGIKLKK